MTSDTIPESDCLKTALHPRKTLELFGQNTAEHNFLTAYHSGRLHHAWLISGPQGVGKATLAWKITKFLLTQSVNGAGLFDPPDHKSGTLNTPPDHPALQYIEHLTEPRVFLCRRAWDETAKRYKKDITISEIRALKTFFTLSAADGGWRIALIDAADDMNASAANALLKILEEPPEKTVFLLVSHQPQQLLPTIRSRCRMLRCEKLSTHDLIQALQNAQIHTGNITDGFAELAEGSVGTAIRLLDSDGLKTYENFAHLIAQAPDINRSEALHLANQCSGKSNEAVYEMTIYLIQRILARIVYFALKSSGHIQEIIPKEADLLMKLSPNLHITRKWADLSVKLSTKSLHARAVNIDPSHVILDILLTINETAKAKS